MHVIELRGTLEMNLFNNELDSINWYECAETF